MISSVLFISSWFLFSIINYGIWMDRLRKEYGYILGIEGSDILFSLFLALTGPFGFVGSYISFIFLEDKRLKDYSLLFVFLPKKPEQLFKKEIEQIHFIVEMFYYSNSDVIRAIHFGSFYELYCSIYETELSKEQIQNLVHSQMSSSL